MESHKLSIKFFAEDPSGLPADAFVRVFHGWIQRQAVPHHLLIDVADYEHVPDGPGTVLVSHEANFHLDRTGGRPGLLYVRKQPFAGAEPVRDRLRAAFRAALEACDRLEQEPGLGGRVRFGTGEFVLRIHDRLLAPSTPDTFAALKPDLEAVLAELYAGSDLVIVHAASGEKLFEVRVQATRPPALADLLQRLGHVPQPLA